MVANGGEACASLLGTDTAEWLAGEERIAGVLQATASDTVRAMRTPAMRGGAVGLVLGTAPVRHEHCAPRFSAAG